MPLNYADPSGPTVSLAVNRLPATGPRLGSLLVNPGGPGGSGVDEVFQGADGFKQLRTRYDIVGFDPRGVGASDPVHCLGTQQANQYYQNDFTPVTQAQKAQTIQAVRGFAQACLRNSGQLLKYVGSENVARDMDIIRASVGDQKLNYLGTSYGTELGQLYAHDFPDRIGRVVLDSVDNPTSQSNTTANAITQSNIVEQGVRAIFESCVSRAKPRCPIGSTLPQAQQDFTALLAALQHRPLPVGRYDLTSALARIGALEATYAPQQLGIALTTSIAQARHGDGRGLFILADLYLSPGSNEQDAFQAVNCLVGTRGSWQDDQRDPARADADIETQADQIGHGAPLFGEVFVYTGAVCSLWPVPPTSTTSAISYTGTTPIVFANNTGDSATPLSDAEQVAARFAGSRLIINQAAGHGVYGNGSCATSAINAYLLNGALPPRVLRCP